RAAQAQPDCVGALSRTILRAMAPARVTQVIAAAAAEAIAARRVVEFLRAAPAQRAREPPSQPTEVLPSGLKGNWIPEGSRGGGWVRCRVIQVHDGMGHVRRVNSVPDANEGAARSRAPLAENTLPHPPRRVDYEALFNAYLLPVPSPPAAAVALPC